MRKLFLRVFFCSIILSLSAITAQSQLVISQVYGGGGNAGSVYRNDFIEIFNRGNSTVNLTGYSVQYASAAGTSWQVTNLSGSVAPGQYYLVQEALGSGGTTNLPTPDATGTIAMSATAGKVILASTTTAFAVACPAGPTVIDLVGFGTTANCFEGTGPTPAPSNTNAVLRGNNGCTDAGNNALDFTAGLPNPRNTASPTYSCSASTVSVTAGIHAAEPATNGTFTLSLSNPAPVGGVTITYSLGGSAVLNTDYSDPQAGSINIAQGNTEGTLTLNVNDDPDFEGTETISITLNTADNGYSILSGAANISLLDNDAPPAVSVAAGVNAAEPATNGTFTLTLSTAAPAGGITVTYTLSGTAILNTDYTDPQGGTVTIAAGNSNATITLNVTDDPDAESPESINITLNTVTSPYTIGTGTASINLTSDDFAPISLTGIYAQDFNMLAITGTTNPLSIPGWLLNETGGGARDNELYAADNGGSNTGDTYSYGTTSATERALGSLQSGTLISSFGSMYVNNTGVPIIKLRITYTGEQWRLGATGRNDRIDFQYSTDASSLTTGSWIDVDALDFVAPNATGTTGALNGNLGTNSASITFDINGLSIPDGATFLIRWNDFNASGADDGLAIDNFSIEANPADVDPPVIAVLSPANGATNVSLNIAASITFDEPVVKERGIIVLKKTSDNSVVTTYSINDGAVVVSSSTVTFPLSNLQANTGYYIEISPGGFKDLSDNFFEGIESSSIWSFTTGNNFYLAEFNGCSSALTDGFTQYSKTGAIVWGCTTFGRDPAAPAGTAPFPYGVQINGFSGGTNVPNVDWLISPSFDLTETTYPLLSFWSRTAFNGLPLQLKVSTDYFGGDPALSTWTDLNGKFPGQASNVWTLSQDINLAAFKLPNVRFAFVYTSSDDDGARWTLDDISLVNSLVPPPPSLTVSTTDIQFTYVASGATADKTFTFIGNDLVNDVTVTSTGAFQLSKDGITFSPSLNYTVAEASDITKTVYVRFAPTQNGLDYTGTVTVSTGALSSLINVKGTSIDPATTLEVVNWNIEWFGSTAEGPSNEALQEQNVKTILESVGADVYALLEIVSEEKLASVVSQMPGYAYVISNYGSHTNTTANPPGALASAQKMAMIYKTSVLSNITTAPLLSQGINSAADLTNPAYNYWASGRFPYMVSADVTLNCITKNIKFILVHAKANTSPTATSYERRKKGADTLNFLLNQSYANDNIIILGDYNDDLDQSITAGFTVTSWSSFVNDADNFEPVTLPLSLAGKKSTVSYNDVIDHVTISNELESYYMPATANILTDVSSLVTNYGNTTSDHYPVFTRYKFEQPAPPVIHCPANVVKSNDAGACGAVVNYEVTYEGNCGTASLQQTEGLPSGAIFPVGTTTNTYVVTDAAGGTATCSFTVTVNDTENPVITCPENITTSTSAGSCSATVNYTVNINDNCSGATVQQTAGLASGAVFPAGTTTNTFVVTDGSGNTATCSFTVTVNDNEAPVFTRPADITILFSGTCSYNASPAITGDVTDEQDNCSVGLQATYTDEVSACGNNIIITRTWHLEDNNGNQAPDQVQIITVTDNNTTYIIYATRSAEFGENNSINGSVGVTAGNGEAEFRKGTILPSPYFVRAAHISVKPGAIVPNRIYSAANDGPVPPFFTFSGNTFWLPSLVVHTSTTTPVSGNYRELRIKKNVTVTITGTLYGKITIEEGAQVTFHPAGGIVNIGELRVEGKGSVSTAILFGDCTSVRIKDRVVIDNNVQVNTNGPKVTFYLGDHFNDEERFKIEGGNVSITANIYIPNGKLKVEGVKNKPTVLTGWFIAEKVESEGKDVEWNSYTCTPAAARGAVTETKAPVKGINEEAKTLEVKVSPNPSTDQFTLRISSSNNNETVTIRIADMSGRQISVRRGVSPNSTIQLGMELKNGVYVAEVTQGKERRVVKLIKL